MTAGSNNVVRVYATGSDGEPTNLDDCQENNTAIAASVWSAATQFGSLANEK